jgi:hypothetical protein
MTDRTKNTVLQEIAWIFEANTADDNTWDACEITERIADILKDEGHFRECDDHGHLSTVRDRRRGG